MAVTRKAVLLRLTKYLIGIAGFGLVYILVDYSIDIRPKNIQSSYHFKTSMSELEFDRPTWLRQDNLNILLIKRSPDLRRQLSEPNPNLQDINSDSSRQPGYAKNILRSRDQLFFVSFAIGTDLTCPLELKEKLILKEICGSASYDFAGRALEGNNQFQNLPIPDYNFNEDFSLLTISID